MTKKLLAWLVFLIAFGASVCVAAGDMGNMHGDKGGQDTIKEEYGQMKHEAEVGTDQMVAHLKRMREHMSVIMGKMATMLKDETMQKREEMHDLMRDACEQMGDISRMEETGKGTNEDIKNMEERKVRMDETVRKVEKK